MEAAISKSLTVDVELIAGSGGIFEVTRDDQLIFSKKQAGRFPESDEVIALLK
ncbi:MAG: Rdx family protein [Proteobacteria bacterium]|nr:Rdx family protein [Pseudomonadota bacterium]MBU1686643.1 Rdx family protein [Pseudomonadota bacterium]